MVYRLSGKKPDEMSTPLTEEEEQEMYDQFNKMDLNDNIRHTDEEIPNLYIV